MYKTKIKIKNLFKFLNIDNEDYEQMLATDNGFFVKTPDDRIVPINGFVKKCDNDIWEYTLGNNTKIKCSNKHLILDKMGCNRIANSEEVLTLDGYQKITNKKFIKCGDVYDISIPDPHLYVTPNGVIHHNTSLAKIIVKDILDCDYLYINASDENGIDTVRTKIMGFAQTKSFDGELKVVILDESDQLSKEAQGGLRNVMETYAGTTRFILTGNHRHKIVPALQSRCQSIDLKPDLKDALKRCLYILEQEKIKVSQEQKKLLVGLVKLHFPDLRKCIGAMQQSCRDGVLSIKAKSNTNELMELIFSNIQKKNGLATRKYWIENDQIFNSDYEQILSDLLNFYYNQPMDEIKKKQSILTIAEYLFKASQVMDKEINAFACVLQLENI